MKKLGEYTGFNRDIVECKLKNVCFISQAGISFNRDIVECKYRAKRDENAEGKVLIET